MKPLTLGPYYHPTTICLIDDNQAFLDSLHLELPSHWAFVSFTQPEQALEFLNQEPSLPPLVDRCVAMDRSDSDQPSIHLDLGMIEQEINHIQRFERISVAVIDYAMPSMNGLELCAQLKDPYIMKAMFTGVADEKIAVEAFNAGLIDRFIPKHAANAITNIKRFVEELQQAYFNQHTARLQNNLAIDPPGFLADPVIGRFIEQLMQDQKLVEYYLVNGPPGLLLLDSAGNAIRLLILDASQQMAQHAYAAGHGAPSTVLNQLKTGAQLGYFWDQPENYFGDEHYPWEEHLFDAKKIQGAHTWYVAIADDPPNDIDFNPATSSFDSFLAQIHAS